jgi:hypothetical protein
MTKKDYAIGTQVDNETKKFLIDRRDNHGQSHSWIIRKAIQELKKHVESGGSL